MTRFEQAGSELDADPGLPGRASSQGTETHPGSDPMSDADAFGLPPPSALPPGRPTLSVTPSPSPPFSPSPSALPPARRRGPIWIVAGAMALLVAAVGSGFAFSNRAKTAFVATLPTRVPLPTRSVTTSVDQPSISPSGSPRGPIQSGLPTGGSTSPGRPAKPPQVAPVVPGWQTVEGLELVAFDVPPDWKIEAPSVLAGFATSGGPQQVVTMHNPATYKRGAGDGTSSTYRAKVGFVSPKGRTAGTAAKESSAQWAKVAGVHADGSDSPVGPTQVSTVKIARGSITATVATTILTVTEPGDCPAPRMSFTAVSLTVKGQVVVVMVYGDQSVPDALPQDVATRVISSLRPI